jgi:CheY-like chemotaxis protein
MPFHPATVPLPATAPLTRPNLLAACCAAKTVLVVEDSRHASDALRLMLRQLGARMRRAGTLAEAGRHLSLYRPDALVVDLGLPDGPGERLIAALAIDPRRPARILALSALPERGPAAMACGADAFVEKPVPGLAALAGALVPDIVLPPASDLAQSTPPPPSDPSSLCDDLAAMTALLRDDPDAHTRRYASEFLSGLARQTGDGPLAAMSAHLSDGANPGLLIRMIADRRAALALL